MSRSVIANKDSKVETDACIQRKSGRKPEDGASTSGSKSSKSKFDQMSEDIDKVAKQIEDELLADFNAVENSLRLML